MEILSQRVRTSVLLSLIGILLGLLALVISGEPPSDPEIFEQEIYFFVGGNLNSQGGLRPVIIELRRPTTFIDMVCNVRQAAGNNTTRIDIQKEGIDLFQNNDVVIFPGQTRGTSGSPVLTTGIGGERLRLNVKATSNAQDLSCQLSYFQ